MGYLDSSGLARFKSKLDVLFNSKLSSTLKGSANGLAELNSSGKVPENQLPSYVDDVVEYSSFEDLPASGETGKIYVTTNTNETYRWSGTTYVAVGGGVALGETSETAYRGDRGKAAYDHASENGKVTTPVTAGLYKVSVTGEGHIGSADAVTKADIELLGIPGADTWRGIQDNLTSEGNTTDSLSANQGFLLANGAARDNSKRSDDAPEVLNWFKGTPRVDSQGGMEVGKQIDFHATDDSELDYSARISADNTGFTLTGTTKGTFSGDLTGDVTGDLTGNADTATQLKTPRSINGTNFDGTSNITTNKWGTTRTITIKDSDSTNAGTAVNVDGSGNVTLPLPSTIKASLAGNVTGNVTGNLTGNVTGNVSGSSGSCTGNAATATKLQTTRSLWGNNFDGTAAISGNITISHGASATMTADSTNPKITFSENGSQPVHLIYTDYDSYRSPAGLKVVGGASASPAWFEVEGQVYAARFNGPVTGNVTGNCSGTAGGVAWGNVSSKPSYYDAKAIKGITRSGTTFTYTCMDGTTGTFTQQDNNTTYSFSDKNVTLAWGTKSTIATVGGTDIHVTMPANPNTDTDKSTKLTVIKQISRGANFDPIQSGYFAGMTTSSGISSSWWHILSMDWNGDDKNNWISQLALPTENRNGIYYRSRQNSTTYAWVKCLDANNYTDYAAKKTEAIKNISRSGTTFTATRCDGTTFTFTQQDNNTTYTLDGLGGAKKTEAIKNITRSGTTFTATRCDGTTFTFSQQDNDTNTWRGIQNNLTSTSTTDSLSAAQGKALNDKINARISSNVSVTYFSSSTTVANNVPCMFFLRGFSADTRAGGIYQCLGGYDATFIAGSMIGCTRSGNTYTFGCSDSSWVYGVKISFTI